VQKGTGAPTTCQVQSDLLIAAGWEGWWLLETSTKPPDRVKAMMEERAM
jgi:hypothetical protein